MKKREIYGTREWATATVNIQNGCEHDCLYCYAKAMAIRFKRSTSVGWKSPVLRAQSIEKGYTQRSGRIMFPSSHDITPRNIEACVRVLKKMLLAGNKVLIVTKPDPDCMSRLCIALQPFKEQVMFRLTIGSANNRILKYWEPNSPTFVQRLNSLKCARKHGYQTSVSCEPMLDDRIDDVIDAVRPYVTDSIWLGKANNLRQAIAHNCPGDARAAKSADELVGMQNDSAIIALYKRYRSDDKIRWKDSIKKVVGLQRPAMEGMDI